MQRRITTDTIVTGLEDRIEDLKNLLNESEQKIQEAFDSSTVRDIDRLYDLCYTFVEYYDWLKERTGISLDEIPE